MALCLCCVAVARAGSGLKLSQAPVPGEQVTRFEVHPDSQQVVYRSGGGHFGKSDILSVPTAGGPTTVLSGTLGRTHGAPSFFLSPDGGYVLMNIAISGDANFSDLYSVPSSGGVPVALLEIDRPGQDDLDFITKGFSSDGTRLLYIANEDPSKNEFFSKPIDGGSSTKIDDLLGTGLEIARRSTVKNSPDGSRMIYLMGVTHYTHLGNTFISAAADGTDQKILHQSAINTLSTSSFLFRPNSDEVVYRDPSNAIYLNDLLGSNPREFVAPPAQGSAKISYITTDGQNLVYTVEDFRAGLYEAYSAPLAGGAPTLLDVSSNGSNFVSLYTTNTDDSQLIYERREMIYSAPMDGSPSTLLTPHHSPTTNVNSGAFFAESSEGTFLVYQTFPEIGATGVNQLYSINLATREVTRLNMPFDNTGPLETGNGFAPTPDGRFVIFGLIDNTVHNFRSTALYAVPIAGGEPVQITPDLPESASIDDFELTPDGSKVVYLADMEEFRVDGLYVSGFPLAAVDPGDAVGGAVAGGVGFGGGVGYMFDHVTRGGTLMADFSRPGDGGTAAAATAPGFVDGPTLLGQHWLTSFDGEFDGSATLTFTYDESVLPVLTDENSLGIYFEGPGDWVLMPILERDTLLNTITIQADQLGRFELGLIPEPASVGLLAAGALALVGRRRLGAA